MRSPAGRTICGKGTHSGFGMHVDALPSDVPAGGR
jgi:hypothetical protein